MSMAKVDVIIFDLGGVLIDWNPRYLYRKFFKTEEAVEYFLRNIATFDWNEEQDRGRSLSIATQLLIDKYPEYTPEIKAYYNKWEEDMLGDAIEGSVDILKSCIDNKNLRVLALTNWSAETFPIAQRKFSFLSWFEGILVSGKEKLIKPDEAIFNRMIERYKLNPSTAVFIDDNVRNIRGAQQVGFQTIHFRDPDQLKEELSKMVEF